MGPLRRDGVPGPEIGVVDAFLRVVVAAEDVPGQGVEKTAVFSGGGRDGSATALRPGKFMENSHLFRPLC